ncbi:FliH/SctL family protein [Candidatus Trichorickettsia mobilis]|uniref:FliH/SctL family protein n=1 Tax=Candidatus Trichorickettsia mobilis TaxID=1346319 RepID=UPI00292CFE64|nr:FliH/SctL family protein [Candidatus Trichorickettsia mobilis]
MHKYSKFVFRELPKTAVVNVSDSAVDSNQEELINNVVTQHLHTIINTEDGVIDSFADQEQHDTFSIDTEQIKLEGYNKGFEEAKIQYESIIDDLKTDNNFLELIQQQLLTIVPSASIDTQIATISVHILNEIAKKLHVILPVNFEQIVHTELLSSIKKFYKEGQIKLTIHSTRQEYCANVLRLDNLPDKLKENIQIVADDTMGINDCKVEWSNTCLEYNQAQLDEEITKILAQLKSTV